MESFANNLIKRPLKLFAWAMALYAASQSFLVAMFLTAVLFFFLKEKAVQWSKVVPAAPKVATPEKAADKEPSVGESTQPPEKQYERSAVVTPIRRTGTHDRS
ncbi:hypothetical protein [Cupriavidus sp. SW-Y-13]|uniref:hypothetical protein n=1 Tax=Cupriavidus sp. SW-Y-13 TaxID=2653854 RepID=UPI0013656B6B|nr:hypothetical protein [Cupriavidus sp. SW-Y-13]MWL91427.1 hypothetical protein [Cupriavidus sp. SW-Y-13]